MAAVKFQRDAMLDAALNFIKTKATYVSITTASLGSQDLTSTAAYTKAFNDPSTSSGYCLAKVAISASDFTGPANGDASGRKLTLNQQSSLSVLGSGANSAAMVAILGVSTSVNYVLYTTTCTVQSLTAGNTVTIPAWKMEIADAT